jgi:hypothetical protein
MSDPNTPSITEAGSGSTQSLNLNEIGLRYLAECQRVFDLAAFLVEGTRQVTESGYDEMTKSVHFHPSEKEHRKFDDAKVEAERYLLKNVLAESLALVVPFLEDIRTFCAVAHWKYVAGGLDNERLREILTTDRSSFLARDLVSKFEYLVSEFSLTTPLTASILALTKAGLCLAGRRGVVSEDDVTNGGALAFSLVALDVLPQRVEGEVPVRLNPRVGELRRSFSIGESIRVDKQDYLHIVSTVAMFLTSTLHAVKETLKSTVPAAA